MKDTGILYQLIIYICFAQHHIRARVSVKGELAVSAGQCVDKGKRCVYRFVRYQSVCIYPRFLRCRFKLPAENVVSHLAYERGFVALFIQHCKHIAGRTAGVCFHDRISVLADTVFGEVNQQFAESAYVKFSHNYSSAQASPNSSALPLNSSERSYTAFVITYSPLFTKTSIIFPSM